MIYEISGTIMQTVAIDLEPGVTVYSHTNTMAWMNDAISMDTHTGGGFFCRTETDIRRRLLFRDRLYGDRKGSCCLCSTISRHNHCRGTEGRRVADLSKRNIPRRPKNSDSRTRMAEAHRLRFFSVGMASCCKS